MRRGSIHRATIGQIGRELGKKGSIKGRETRKGAMRTAKARNPEALARSGALFETLPLNLRHARIRLLAEFIATFAFEGVQGEP
jgi:hypothetical protein